MYCDILHRLTGSRAFIHSVTLNGHYLNTYNYIIYFVTLLEMQALPSWQTKKNNTNIKYENVKKYIFVAFWYGHFHKCKAE